jgi:HSP20 family protein
VAEKTIAVPETQEVTAKPEGTRMREHYVTPPVDIYETPEKLVVMVDVPGATDDHLDVRVDNHILTFRGQASYAMTGESIYREYELVNYFRQFELSDKVDEGSITAELKHGVLTLSLPKAEKAKPRQITVAVN